MTTPRSLRNPQPSVHLHIERLVLDGMPLAPAEVPRFQAALEQELSRLLAANPAAWSGGAIARLDAGAVHLAPGGSAQTWGRQTARTLAASFAAKPERANLNEPSGHHQSRTTGLEGEHPRVTG